MTTAKKKAGPTTIVIFGGTGDLAQKKLFSALLDLSVRGLLPVATSIIGLARDSYTNEEYRDFVRRAIERRGHGHPRGAVDAYLETISYQQASFDKASSYNDIGDRLNESDERLGRCTNKLFYLAVPPVLYGTIFEHLASSGLSRGCGKSDEWVRLLVEKPFGKDLDTARRLDEQLGRLFDEEQIFRIDHYLAKDAIQNLIAFRFSNVLFENSWNRDYIERVHIKLYENKGIQGRGSFYSATGALRDVGQNHMLQMLALVAMENPGTLKATSLRLSREEILNALRPYDDDDLAQVALRGQYDGYDTEEGVTGASDTETYFLLKTKIATSRWRGVPFYLESGKSLREDRIEVEVVFRALPSCICGSDVPQHHKNILTMTFAPDEAITMSFWVKEPGLSFKLERQDLTFTYHGAEGQVLPDAYEKVLYDCIVGDRTLFVGTKEVEAAWCFIMPILEGWQKLPLYRYSRGSVGPKERDEIL